MSGMSDTQLRNEAGRTNFDSFQDLTKFCKGINQGWYRCQALAASASKLPNQDRMKACNAAITAANTEKDEYRKLAVQVWVVEAMYECGFMRDADQLVVQLIQSSGRIIPSNSQGYMLEMLFERCKPDRDDHRIAIMTKLVSLLESKGGWRVERACIHCSKSFYDHEHDAYLNALLAKCTNQRLVRRIKNDRDRKRS